MKKPTPSPDPATITARDLRVYCLKITLGYTAPPIWRRLEVYGGISMDSLATAIETAFGWSGEHLAEFNIKGRTIGDDTGWSVDDPDFQEDVFQQLRQVMGNRASKKEKAEQAGPVLETIFAELRERQESAEEDEDDIPALWELVPRVRTKFTYTYDFGDSWKHMVEVEKIAPAELGVRYPRCADGARADPLEDCGGVWGFAELVEAAGNPKHERFADLEEWGLEKWDPAKFSADEVSRKLAKVFRLKKRRT